MIINGIKINFSQFLAGYLEYKDLSQIEFCSLTGFDPPQVSRWLKGANEPHQRTIDSIEKKLGDFMAYSDQISASKKNVEATSDTLGKLDKIIDQNTVIIKQNKMIISLLNEKVKTVDPVKSKADRAM